jgi:P-type Mg2+ transporter
MFYSRKMLISSLLTQILVVVMLRTQHIPFFQSSPSRVLGSALASMSVVGLTLPYIPRIAPALQMQRPHPTFYGFLVAILISYVLLVQGVKVVYKRIYKQWL